MVYAYATGVIDRDRSNNKKLQVSTDTLRIISEYVGKSIYYEVTLRNYNFMRRAVLKKVRAWEVTIRNYKNEIAERYSLPPSMK